MAFRNQCLGVKSLSLTILVYLVSLVSLVCLVDTCESPGSDLIIDIWIKSVNNNWALRVYLVLTLTLVLSMYPKKQIGVCPFHLIFSILEWSMGIRVTGVIRLGSDLIIEPRVTLKI